MNNHKFRKYCESWIVKILFHSLSPSLLAFIPIAHSHARYLSSVYFIFLFFPIQHIYFLAILQQIVYYFLQWCGKWLVTWEVKFFSFNSVDYLQFILRLHLYKVMCLVFHKIYTTKIEWWGLFFSFLWNISS